MTLPTQVALREKLKAVADMEDKARLIRMIELNRAAITVQKSWKGYFTRKWFADLVVRSRELRRINAYEQAKREAYLRAMVRGDRGFPAKEPSQLEGGGYARRRGFLSLAGHMVASHHGEASSVRGACGDESSRDCQYGRCLCNAQLRVQGGGQPVVMISSAA